MKALGILLLFLVGCGAPCTAPTIAYYKSVQRVTKDTRAYYTNDASMTELDRKAALLQLDAIDDFTAQALSAEVIEQP